MDESGSITAKSCVKERKIILSSSKISRIFQLEDMFKKMSLKKLSTEAYDPLREEVDEYLTRTENNEMSLCNRALASIVAEFMI